MRFMVIVHASDETEAGELPNEQDLAKMGKFSEELVNAGMMVAGEGLHPSSEGARIRFERGGRTTVINGPFAPASEQIAGFWILDAGSKDEVLEVMRRAPFDPGSTLEIRQLFEAEEFGDAYTPELREQDERLRDRVLREKQGAF